MTDDAETIATEAELLAEPDEAYMRPAQLAFFRKRLLAQRQQLLTSGEGSLHELREAPEVRDDADRASVSDQLDVTLRLRDRERKLLPKIDAALRRIDASTYGWCEETGERIGLRRLLARPTTTLSVEGQLAKEAAEKHYAG